MLRFGAISGKQPNNICLAGAQAFAAIRINEVVCACDVKKETTISIEMVEK